MVLGGMMVGKDDIPILLQPFGSLRSFMAAARLLLRHATDRLRFARGTRLVMGNALVARLFYSLKTRNVPIEFDARLVDLVQGHDRVEGAVVDIGPKRRTIRARRGVILATGGFAPNEKLRAEFMRGLPVGAFQRFRGRERRGFRGGARCRSRSGRQARQPGVLFPELGAQGDRLSAHPARPRQARPDRGEQGRPALRRTSSDSYHDFVEAMFRTNVVSPSVPAWLICDRSFIRDYGLGLVHPGASRARRSNATSRTAICTAPKR